MRRLASLLVPALLAGALAAGPAHRADAACAAANARTISGGVRGSDGEAVNVFVGLDVLDRYGHHIQLNGCQGGAGFAIGAGADNGFYSIYKLARNQRYDVRVTITSPTSGRKATKRLVNVLVGDTCHNTPLNIAF